MNTNTKPETTMLYVEDDEITSTVTTKGLVKRGFTVCHAESTEKAQNFITNNYFEYALLDLKLADGLSLDLIPTLIDKNKDIKILVLTGYASIATAVQAIKMGATNYLSKPTTIDDIVTAFKSNSLDTNAVDPETEKMSVKRLEWEHIQRALTENDGNISATARQLKMHRRTLQRKLQKKPVSE